MSRVSFLVGFDRTGQASSADITGAVESDSSATGHSGRILRRKDEEHLADFWEETRLGLVRRMREKNEIESVPSAVLAASSAKNKINLNIASQIRKRAYAAKVQASKKARFIVHPNDPRKLCWDLFVGTMIVYSILLIPWRISFKQDAWGFMLYFDYFVDCVFGFDIILCFNAAYFEEDVLVYKRGVIARKYLSTWFVPDFLGTVPLATLTKVFLRTLASNNNRLQSVKLLRAMRGIRLVKLMRILRLSSKTANIDFTRHFNPSIVRLIKLLAKIVFAAHLLCCLWFIMDECDVDGGGDLWQTCGGASLRSKYLASLYWTIATLMSVGYGDISANNNQERLFALFTMVIGSTAFGFIIAMVTVIVETMDPQATAKSAKMEVVREYMGVRRLPKALQVRMRKHFDHVYRNTSVFRQTPILRDLPYTVRVKLVLDTHQELLHTLSFFEDLDVPVVTEIVYRLKPMQVKRKEYVGKAGDVLDDVFFVVKGKVEARISKPGKQVLVALHSEGSDFELSSLVRCRPMQFTYRAVIQSELMWLDKDDLETIAIGYTTAVEVITEKAERQSVLLEECLSLAETYDGSDYRQSKVLVNWLPVPAENISELVGGGLMSVVLEPGRPDDADDSAPLIRTLRPITDKGGQTGHHPSAFPVPPLGSKMLLPPVGGDGGEEGGDIVGQYWGDEGAENNNEQPSGGGRSSRDTRRWKRQSSATERGEKAEEEEQERKERTPPHMEEALETAESVASRWVVIPSAGWKQKWDTLGVMLITLSVITVPFRIGFDAVSEGGWLMVDWVIDIMFALDIMFNFRMAYMKAHVLVTSPSLMATHYLKGWFTLDLLSTVPFDRIMSLMMGGESSSVFRGLKLVKVLRMVRLLRLFRVFKIARFQVIAEEFIEMNNALFRGMKLVLTLAILGHFFGCFWSFVSLFEESSGDDDSSPSRWWESLGLEEDDLPRRYIASIYWAFTTMTTVGYGDIFPVVDNERVYAMIIMVIGATVFGYIVGSVSALASNPNGSQARETVKILAVSNYLGEKKVQTKLRQAVKKHVEHYLQHKSPFQEEDLQALMPPSLRQESVLQIHKDVIVKIGIFSHLNANHIAYMLRQMKPIFTLSGNYVYSPSNGSDGVYFLLAGVAEAVRQEEGTDRCTNLYIVREGKCFGHEGFLQNEGGNPPGKVGMRALADCSIFLLTDKKIANLAKNQPDVASQLQVALRRAIAEQEITPIVLPPRSSRPMSAPSSARAFVEEALGIQRDIGAVEAGRGGGGGGGGGGRRAQGGGGAKVLPTEEGGG